MLGKRRRPWILNSTPRIADSRYQEVNLNSLSVDLGFWIQIDRGIPGSLCCIPNPRTQDSGFHKQKIPEFRIPRAKLPRIHGETRLSYFSPNFLRKNLEKQKTKNAENYGMNQQICWRDF